MGFKGVMKVIENDVNSVYRPEKCIYPTACFKHSFWTFVTCFNIQSSISSIWPSFWSM